MSPRTDSRVSEVTSLLDGTPRSRILIARARRAPVGVAPHASTCRVAPSKSRKRVIARCRPSTSFTETEPAVPTGRGDRDTFAPFTQPNRRAPRATRSRPTGGTARTSRRGTPEGQSPENGERRGCQGPCAGNCTHLPWSTGARASGPGLVPGGSSRMSPGGAGRHRLVQPHHTYAGRARKADNSVPRRSFRGVPGAEPALPPPGARRRSGPARGQAHGARRGGQRLPLRDVRRPGRALITTRF